MLAKQTFKDLLAAVEDENDARIFRRARLANELAKPADRPLARRRCYAVKAGSLDHGVRKFPDSYGLASIENDGGLLGLSWNRRANLHVPTDALSERALDWVCGRRVTLVTEHRDLACAAAA